ncbi:hypothetical protein GAO09_10930 [Rhizobiales bacterium RZME27]|uniref:Uncharacterized protein n=1 Tax=Endobacterium cereale TaxID=2663029 RepID=A0A6A8A9K8_9HYPH|nr:hypothetical protein [Endobacterium cereale]MEB2846726.1 hypothetical protein [Endobacterium cereale]MQY46557.1 hypothetical protein [Endobacterium cereale]
MDMNRIFPPTTDRHPDRFLQCQEAMAGAFTDVALQAVKAGWNPEEVASALVELADHMMLGMIANRDLTEDLSVLRRR